ncbi:MAG: YitT family protein [Bacilli bacterium]|nr:YitT family protein [Bacilli bacterium]
MKILDKAKENILDEIENKNLVQRYIMLIIGILIYAVGYNAFFVPNNLVFGGSGGIALILKDYIDPSITIMAISIIALILGIIFLGKRFAFNSIIGSVLFPLFVELTKDVSLPVPKDDMMLIVICGAVMIGVGTGLVGRAGLSSGGVDTIIQILVSKLKISFGTAFMIVNGLIVILGGYTFGRRILLYALIIIYIINIVTDKVLLSISMNKTFFIVTTEVDKVKEYILNNLSRGVTIIDAHGGFSDDKKKLIMTVIPTAEYFKAKEGILEIDKNAFFTITDSYQVYGQDSHRNDKGGMI